MTHEKNYNPKVDKLVNALSKKPKKVFPKQNRLEVGSSGCLNVIKPNNEVVLIAKIKHDIRTVTQLRSCPEEFVAMVQNYTKSIEYTYECK